MKTDTLVIGGGVVGLCCALALQRQNQNVTVVARDSPQDSTVSASCGWIAPSEILPLSRPGVLLSVPAWLLNPSGPLSIKFPHCFHCAPWFVKFIRNSTRAKIKSIATGLAALTRSALTDYYNLLRPLGLQHLVGNRPVLRLFDNESALERAYRETVVHESPLGFDTAMLDNRQLRQIEPALSPNFAGALQLQDWRSVTDIHTFLRDIAKAYVDRGGRLQRAVVMQIKKCGERIEGVALSDGQLFRADQYVFAAGAWTKGLARQIGVKLPIASVAGYQCMSKVFSVGLGHGVIWAKGGFGITPYTNSLGIAGTIQFAGLNAALDLKRAREMACRAKRVLPGLDLGNCEFRAGWRPMCPDTLPIIDRMPGCRNAFLACGHGQLGLTLAAITGRLVADLVCDRVVNVPLYPYRAARFYDSA